MNPGTKNKLLTGLVVLLLVANAATITMFWMDKGKHPLQPKGTPQEFLVNELKLDAKQQDRLAVLVREHQQMTGFIRIRIKQLKQEFFDLLKQPDVPDSTKNRLSTVVSTLTKQLDIVTLEHFQKVRALCTADQQKKFDEIIQQATSMMGQPRPPMGPHNDPQGPPPGDLGGDMPPPHQ